MATESAKLVVDSKERVAFDLMEHIASYQATEQQRKDKKYWLSLYMQCLKAASGHSLENVLKET